MADCDMCAKIRDGFDRFESGLAIADYRFRRCSDKTVNDELDACVTSASIMICICAYNGHVYMIKDPECKYDLFDPSVIERHAKSPTMYARGLKYGNVGGSRTRNEARYQCAMREFKEEICYEICDYRGRLSDSDHLRLIQFANLYPNTVTAQFYKKRNRFNGDTSYHVSYLVMCTTYLDFRFECMLGKRDVLMTVCFILDRILKSWFIRLRWIGYKSFLDLTKIVSKYGMFEVEWLNISNDFWGILELCESSYTWKEQHKMMLKLKHSESFTHLIAYPTMLDCLVYILHNESPQKADRTYSYHISRIARMCVVCCICGIQDDSFIQSMSDRMLNSTLGVSDVSNICLKFNQRTIELINCTTDRCINRLSEEGLVTRFFDRYMTRSERRLMEISRNVLNLRGNH